MHRLRSKQKGLRVLTAIALCLYLALSFRVGSLLVKQQEDNPQPSSAQLLDSPVEDVVLSKARATTTPAPENKNHGNEHNNNTLSITSIPTSKDDKATTISSTAIEKNATSFKNDTIAFLLNRFRPEHAPIMGWDFYNSSFTNSKVKNKTNHKNKPVSIRILLFEHRRHHIQFRKGPTWAIGDEMLNICMDGFERSPYFDLVNYTVVPDFTLQTDDNESSQFVLEEDEDIVWVVDMRRTVMKGSYTIGKQLVVAANATLQYQRKRAKLDPTFRIPSLKVVLLDYRDKIAEQRLCTKGARKLISLLGVGNVRSVVQQIVRGREFSAAPPPSVNERNDTMTSLFVNPGHVWDSREDNECFGFPTLHVPYTVRSDYVDAIQEALSAYQSMPQNQSSSSTSPVDTKRTLDVAHFWPVLENENCAKLRNAVTETVLSLNGTTHPMNSEHLIRTMGDFVSKGTGVGRTTVSSSYVEALLTTKIIVVAQRDEWEDHYRLFEAVVGGALVLSDPMWSLPDGLVDGESIVIYRSLDHLRELLLYYLDPSHDDERLVIAQRGWTIATQRHRSYHRMEALFFGQRLTT